MRRSWAATLFFCALALAAQTPSEVCGSCHREIFDSYRSTGMARSSGAVASIDAEGSFAHAQSGAAYRVLRQDGASWFAFQAGGFGGRRRLDYFVGSGAVGRSYLYAVDGFLYQAPVSWYAAPARWDLSPGYQQYASVFLTRPVEPVCLDCHSSALQPVAGTANGYRSPPFLEGGVSCERCHGPGQAHAAGRGSIVNPATLAPGRRDSVCAQCHLAGVTRVARAGRAGSYRPGDRLADSLVVFEWSGSPDMNVTSHFETLDQSACKQAAGDRLWCGSCHDPHRAPKEAGKAAFYRSRCQACHQPSQCARGPDCAGCHMPKRAVRDVEHSAYTDHAIRKPGAAPKGVAETGTPRRLVTFGGVPAGDREWGLAYATLPASQKLARQYLERAPANDPEVLAQLAWLSESAGDGARAAVLYQQALRLDPSQVAAAVNLGNQYIRSGQAPEAIRWWRHALERSPGLESVRLSLAVALYRSGDGAAGSATLRQLLELDPTNAAARKLLNEAREGR